MTDARLIETLDEVRHQVRAAHQRAERVALVPTRGSLHDGHTALIRTAHAQCDLVIVSIMSNAAYQPPRTNDHDLDLASLAGADIVYRPPRARIIDRRVMVRVASLRSTDLDSLATLATQQLVAIRPDVVYVGDDHYEHARLVHDIVEGLALDLEVRTVAAHRDPDGIPVGEITRMSDAERRAAAAIPHALRRARELADAGERSVMRLCARAEMTLADCPDLTVIDVDIMNAATWQPVDRITGDTDAVLVVTAAVDGVRISDSIPLPGARTIT